MHDALLVGVIAARRRDGPRPRSQWPAAATAPGRCSPRGVRRAAAPSQCTQCPPTRPRRRWSRCAGGSADPPFPPRGRTWSGPARVRRLRTRRQRDGLEGHLALIIGSRARNTTPMAPLPSSRGSRSGRDATGRRARQSGRRPESKVCLRAGHVTAIIEGREPPELPGASHIRPVGRRASIPGPVRAGRGDGRWQEQAELCVRILWRAHAAVAGQCPACQAWNTLELAALHCPWRRGVPRPRQGGEPHGHRDFRRPSPRGVRASANSTRARGGLVAVR